MSLWLDEVFSIGKQQLTRKSCQENKKLGVSITDGKVHRLRRLHGSGINPYPSALGVRNLSLEFHSYEGSNSQMSVKSASLKNPLSLVMIPSTFIFRAVAACMASGVRIP